MAGDSQKVAQALADRKRLAALEATGLLDTAPEEEFDRFTRLAARLVRAPVTLVSLVDDRRQFFKSGHGLARRETPLSHSFCKHVVADATPLVVSDARTHPLLCANLAIRDLQVIAYLGMPLVDAAGQALGSFCAIDSEPRQWAEEDIAAMRELAGMVMERIELRVAARALQAEYLSLREAELRRDELVHMVVHDLRNPLSSIVMGMDEVSKAQGLSAHEREFAAIAVRDAEKLIDMVSSILDVSKAEHGHLQLSREDVWPAELAKAACDQLAAMAARRKVALKLEAAPGMARVSADVEKMRRVLVNLIANALQHTPQGGQVAVDVAPEAGGARFTVRDTGCGVAPEAFERIFQKYGQVGGSKIARASTGLGLPFARLAVEAHGGRISVESDLGRGTAFIVTLPAKPA